MKKSDYKNFLNQMNEFQNENAVLFVKLRHTFQKISENDLAQGPPERSKLIGLEVNLTMDEMFLKGTSILLSQQASLSRLAERMYQFGYRQGRFDERQQNKRKLAMEALPKEKIKARKEEEND